MKPNHVSTKSLTRLLNCQTNGDEEVAIEFHLSTCQDCQRQLENLVGQDSWWRHATDLLNESAELKGCTNTAGRSTSLVIAKLDPDVDFCDLAESDDRFNSQETSSYRHHRLLLDPATQSDLLGRIGSFAVEKLIGHGGMGVVYKGFDAELNRPVAIKFLAPHLASNHIARQRFARESRAAAAVVHPNVVPIYSVDASPDRPYIVMAWVAGRSLQTYVQQDGPVSVIDAVRIAQQIADGLSAAHRQGLVHRDIKPGNILLGKDVSRVMITDFGLAQAADEASLTQSGWLAGTPNYMSPEQATGDPVDSRSDLFSLGSVMYFMLTGREPFNADKPFAVLRKIIAERPHSIRGLNNEVPALLEKFIFRLLSKDPRHRFESSSDASQFLTHYLAHLQNPKMHKRPKLNSTRSRPIVTTAISTIVLLAMTSLGFLFQSTMWPPAASNKNLDPPTSDSTAPANRTSSFIRNPSSSDRPLSPQGLQLETEIQALLQTMNTYESKQNAPPSRPTKDSFDSLKQQLKNDLQRLEQKLR